ncbi:transporter substrate-binding domain-containing protein [Shewanella sp. VB17]|uniref:transporter substrate-binding domain-containing protein n=1 Tax=Shewanella sp. VB17 TaxID=2739432 RepID=UPI0015675E79|nr:transporter substrate-binding domain-containing protein [Shewanella sp. VB17]NRD74731.1 transporter substrate-binding domain-containing protein [Shewanella sp. VB17]
MSSPRFYTVRLYIIAWISLCSIFSVSAYGEVDENRELYSNMNTRLSYMKAVALHKWQHQLPIEDVARETLVINKSIALAKEQGLVSQDIVHFFRAQIELAKKIQRQYHQQWREHGLPSELQAENSTAASLSEIRPQLIVLGQKIIQGVASHHDKHDFSLFNQQINIPFVNLEDKGRLFQALTAINPNVYPSRLDRVLAQKILYVGTTGDYEPFSYFDGSKRRGIDIDLAELLAGTLGAKAVFLPSTWASLSQDLMSQRYDIMMSGISKTLFRQQIGLMSDVYLEGGKTPITLCSSAERFNSLAKIDSSNTRVIVNKGGTNQRFVDDKIKQAKVTVHDSNVTIFQELLAGRADVMITDRIEVQLQSKKHPQLCASMPEHNLTYSAKAFFMNRDFIWKEYVDSWLEITIKNGSMADTFADYL